MKMYSRVYAKIDLDAIHHNMEAMHALLKEDTKIFAVIKTDGYGHGAVPIAKEIESLDYLFGYCTATVEEALILRNHGIKKPILILGYTFPEEYEDIVKNDLRPAVFTLEMAQELSDVAGRLGKDVYVHIKADTGMSRIGLQVNEESAKTVAKIAAMPHMIMEGIFTHFARADERDKTSAHHQMDEFNRMIELCKKRADGVENFDYMIGHTNIKQAEDLEKACRKAFGKAPLVVFELGGVVSANTGPDTVALVYTGHPRG